MPEGLIVLLKDYDDQSFKKQYQNWNTKLRSYEIEWMDQHKTTYSVKYQRIVKLVFLIFYCMGNERKAHSAVVRLNGRFASPSWA